MENKTKKCPVCNSTRTHEAIGYFSCDKCGFINKKTKGKETDFGFPKKVNNQEKGYGK